jgi:hypothetical protein
MPGTRMTCFKTLVIMLYELEADGTERSFPVSWLQVALCNTWAPS